VKDIWDKKERPAVFLAKDGRVLPIKDMLVEKLSKNCFDRQGFSRGQALENIAATAAVKRISGRAACSKCIQTALHVVIRPK